METKLEFNDDILQSKLFIECVREAMASYRSQYREAEQELAKKGMRFRRGAYDRTLGALRSPSWFAEQYSLCLSKQCKEPSTIRSMICAIGDEALVMTYNKLQTQKEDEK